MEKTELDPRELGPDFAKDDYHNAKENEHILSSFELVDPEDIKLSSDDFWESEDDLWEKVRCYKYEREIGGYRYNFTITTYDGAEFPSWEEGYDDDTKPTLQEYHSGRIDFGFENQDFITNIGIKNIQEGTRVVEDLFRFIYLKNRAQYLIIDASKFNFEFDNIENLSSSIKSRIETLKNRPENEILLKKFWLYKNPFSISNISILNGRAYIEYVDQEEAEVMTTSDFLDKMSSDEFSSDIGRLYFVAHILSEIDREKGSKKQNQRLNLYGRQLSKMGFQIQRKEDRIYANVTPELLEKLFGETF